MLPRIGDAPMPDTPFTQKTIDSLSSNGKDRFVWDGDLKGFGVRIKPTGVKSYLIQYRNSGGATRRYSLGKIESITLKDARKLARVKLAAVAGGNDPSADRKKERAAQTIAELGQYFLDVYAVERKLSKRYVADCRGLINNTISKRWGAVKIKTVTRDHVRRLKIELAGTPIRANRCLSLLSKMFNLAIEQGERADNPVIGIERNQEHRRDAYMSLDELKLLLEVLNREDDQDQADAVRLLLVTGARIGEVVGASWSEFDLEAKRWVKPPSKTKQRRVHRVGLNTFAVDILKSLKARAEHQAKENNTTVSAYLFPRREDQTRPRPEIKKFWFKVSRKACLQEFVLYDARHTFASHALVAGVSLGVVGALLGHSNPATTARYAHVAETATGAASENVGDLFKGLI